MNHWPSGHVAFSPDRKRLAFAGEKGLGIKQIGSNRISRVLRSEHGRSRACAYSPDGKTVATLHRGEKLVVWDLERGKGRTVEGVNAWVMAFFPDGTLVVAGNEGPLSMVDPLTGASAVLVADPGDTRFVAVSPDGRLVASVAQGDPSIHVWEVASGTRALQLQAQSGRVSYVGFSQDGRRIASSHSNTTILIWDLAPISGRKVVEELWKDLAVTDAAAARRAVTGLARAPGQAIGLIRGLISKQVSDETPEIVRKLVDGLDDDDVLAREEASEKLKGLGPECEPFLRRVLAGTSSAEVRVRLQELIGRLDLPAGLKSGNFLRRFRSIEVLEHIGTPEARAALESLPANSPYRRERRLAKASLQRLQTQRVGE